MKMLSELYVWLAGNRRRLCKWHSSLQHNSHRRIGFRLVHSEWVRLARLPTSGRCGSEVWNSTRRLLRHEIPPNRKVFRFLGSGFGYVDDTSGMWKNMACQIWCKWTFNFSRFCSRGRFSGIVEEKKLMYNCCAFTERSWLHWKRCTSSAARKWCQKGLRPTYFNRPRLRQRSLVVGWRTNLQKWEICWSDNNDGLWVHVQEAGIALIFVFSE